jgi:quercetin dioxygenase-like cupin family protein
MDLVNAIAKVRFASARPQRIPLHDADGIKAELVCLEPGQKLSVARGRWTYYTITGAACLTWGGQTAELPSGHLAATGPDEAHELSNRGERRTVCLVLCALPEGEAD